MKKLALALLLTTFALSIAVAADSTVSNSANGPKLHAKGKKHKHHSHKHHQTQHHKQAHGQNVVIPVEPSLSAGQFYHI